VVDAIKVKTDQMNFSGTDIKATLDGEEVDVGAVNGVSVTGPDDFKADVSALATAAAVATLQSDVTIVQELRQNRLEFDITSSPTKAYIWNTAGSARKWECTLTDKDGADVTTLTRGPINATAWSLVP